MRGQGPPPPGMSKRERQANKFKFEGSKKPIRHQVLYEAIRKSRVQRRGRFETGKVGWYVYDTFLADRSGQPIKQIDVHPSHPEYMPGSSQSPFELVEMKYQRDMQARYARHDQSQMHEVHLQNVAQRNQINANAQRPPGRIGANGVPVAMAASQQQLAHAVAAANAARPNVSVQNGGPIVNGRGLYGNQGPPSSQQVMQMLQAQGLTARQAQTQAQLVQAHTRLSSNGTPQSQNGNLSASPYSQPPNDLPNGDIMHASPAMPAAMGPHSSPQQALAAQQAAAMGRAPSVPMVQPPHLRVSSNGSPQIGNGPIEPHTDQ